MHLVCGAVTVAALARTILLTNHTLCREAGGGGGQDSQKAPRPHPGATSRVTTLAALTRPRRQVICEKAEGSDIPEIDRKK